MAAGLSRFCVVPLPRALSALLLVSERFAIRACAIGFLWVLCVVCERAGNRASHRVGDTGGQGSGSSTVLCVPYSLSSASVCRRPPSGDV